MTTTQKDVLPPEVKAKQSADINAQIKAFLADGGEIDVSTNNDKAAIACPASFTEY